jgi:peptidoglycan/LPS O-acetylase OafA/YrhL
MRTSGFRTDIQGLRAIAVLLVLLFHFETGLKGGYLGVDMFFVISGFVIASSTLREIDRTDTFSWSAFLHRRVRRLLPGTALVVVATALMSMVLLSPFGPQQETAKMFLGAATYTSNFILMPHSYFSLDPKANPLLHMWSLAVEEQFYLVWPIAIIVLVGLRKRIQTQAFRVILWTAAMVVFLASCWLFLVSATQGQQVSDYRWFKPFIQWNITPEFFAFYSPFTRAWEFIAGVVVALLLQQRIASRFLKAGSLIAGCGVALVVVGVTWASRFPEVQHESTWSTNTSATLAVVIGTALWVFGGSNDNLIRPLISTRSFVLIGDCSYSIYLVHWPIWVLLITNFDQNWKIMVIAFALSLGLGWLQTQFIEVPIRSRTRLQSTSTLRFVGVFGLIAIGGVAAMSYTTPVIARHLTGSKPNEIALHVIERPCVGQRFELENAQSCLYSSSNNEGTAILVGDSMAKSLSEGFVQAANSQGLIGYVFSYPGCSFQLSDSPFTATNECASWRADVLSAMQQLQPKVVIIANLHSLYVDPPIPDRSIEDTQLIWGSELKRTVEVLSVLRAQVIIAQPPPKFEFDLRYDLSLLKTNSVKEDREVVVSRRKTMNEIEQIAISGFQYVQPIVEFTDQFCDDKVCDPRVDNILMFEDTDHLSVDGSKYVSPEIERAISEALSS